MSAVKLAELVQGGEIRTVMVAVPDLLGRLKGKRIDALHFLSQLPAGPEMCAYVLATDAHMTPLPGFDLTGWHTGYGDLRLIPDMTAIRRLSYLTGTVVVHADAAHADCRPVDVAPRWMLRSQLKTLEDLGMEVRVGIESEFMLYEGSGEENRRRGYRSLTPVSPHNLDYALDHPPALAEFFHDLQDTLYLADSPVEAVKTEGAPGQIEVSWPYGDPIRACDTYTVHQHAVRHLAAVRRLTPTFMAAPDTGIGSGLHLNVSLWRDGDAAFTMDAGAELPDLLRQSVAGLMSALPHLAPLYAPTPNSYRRYAAHSFAPTNYTWGVDNRTCAVRIAGHHESTRLEIRLPGADANVYLALAAVLAGIVHGITREPKLPAPTTGDAYDILDAPPVPRGLDEALASFHGHSIPESAFGTSVVQHYSHVAETEIEEVRHQVTDVDRERGFAHA
ncbi:glutamine synthetase family protein [Streptomyces sp. NBC_00243]|uniref:glutamine synthetase family protein n=1 Tax=Streptomyces sp. NBC_00243 TaxID=2975688 RepID=UPI002DD85622|nr:glutamine synthetase family protein [Streptomyces sp. NBC_00243]WRZ24334.1 glutamine synthetase family protein [Streptomyces sp. NBC_00243]